MSSVSQNAAKSGVWVYYKRLDNNEAECLLCPTTAKNKRVLKTPGKSTSILHTHLKAYHPLEYGSVASRKDLTKAEEKQKDFRLEEEVMGELEDEEEREMEDEREEDEVDANGNKIDLTLDVEESEPSDAEA